VAVRGINMTTTLRLQISAPDHLQATVDVWLAALRLLPADPRALAALMKSDTPLPNSIRYLLGELFNPGRPALLDVQAVPKQTNAHTKAISKLSVSLEYYQRTRPSQTSQSAAEEIAELHGVTSRQVYKWLAEGMPGQFESRLIEFTEQNNSQKFSDCAERIAHHNDELANDLIIGALSMMG
jgi:hypothetical protein